MSYGTSIPTWTQNHSWELLKLYCTYESLGRRRGAEELVSNEDSGSVGLCGPEILMCREFPLRCVQLESGPHFVSEGERVLTVSVSVGLNSAPLDSGSRVKSSHLSFIK